MNTEKRQLLSCCIFFILLNLFDSCSSETWPANHLRQRDTAQLNIRDGRSFTIDYQNNSLMKDGTPFRYVSGTVHYFRVPRYYWCDRLMRLRAMGANVLQTYVEWNSHEPENNLYNFQDQNDLIEYLHEAQRHDLLVILRVGPYIDAEREMGGLPYWLLSYNPNMKLRSMDADYIFFVDRWFDKLLPMIKPLLYEHGGPVIMIQVENEYGSYFACDLHYTDHLKKKLRQHLGENIVLFTTDGSSVDNLKCGRIADVYATVDFGSERNVSSAFMAQRVVTPRGPLINSEYYPGWLDHWGYPHSTRKTSAIMKSLKQQLEMGANVNIYVAHGGTSFGFKAGADLTADGVYQPCPTSYDYDAPIAENGALTPKYYAIRNLSIEYTGPAPRPPTAPTARAYGKVYLNHSVSLFAIINELDASMSKNPQTFEQLQQSTGFVLYQHRVTTRVSDPVKLRVNGLRDRGYVFVDENLQGILSRAEDIYEMPLRIKKGQELSILVENQGRVCFGTHINDIKGILSAVYLGNAELLQWNHTSLSFNGTQTTQMSKLLDIAANTLNGRKRFVYNIETPPKVPALYSGVFHTSLSSDTFLRLDGWGRGVAFLNGFNLGRYWPSQGPQVTLYVPKTLIAATNRLILLELEQPGCTRTSHSFSESPVKCSVTLTNKHVLNGPTPYR